MALLNKEMATKNTIKILEKELADDNFLLTLFRDLINSLKGELGNYKQQRNELIEDMAKLRERNAELEKKANAWDELKSQLLSTYHQSERNFDISGGDDERGIMTKHAEVLETMDELDGEDDFHKMINKTEEQND